MADSAVEPSVAQCAEDLYNAETWSRRMCRLHDELQELSQFGWIFGAESTKLKHMMAQAQNFRAIPASQRVLDLSSTRSLLASRCGRFRISQRSQRDNYQDPTLVSIHACKALQECVAQFSQRVEEIGEDAYPLSGVVDLRLEE